MAQITMTHSYRRFLKMSNKCTNRFNYALVPSTGNTKRILRDQELPLRSAYSLKGLGHVSNDKRESIDTLDQPFQSIGFECLPPFPTSRTKSTSAAVNPDIESNSHVCRYIWHNVARERRRVLKTLTSSDVWSRLKHPLQAVRNR